MSLPETTTHQDYLLTININDQVPVPSPVDGTEIHPLFLDSENGTWVLYVKFPPGTLLPTHFHTGTVHFFTTRGVWNYVEYPHDKQTAGSYLYEPAGSIHTFSVPGDASEPAEGFMVVSGANVNFDESGNYQDIMDAGSILSSISAVCAATGREEPKFIRPQKGSDLA